jgi:hypothetical protein
MPFESKAQFQLVDLLYYCAELSTSNIDALLDIWVQSVHESDIFSPFNNHDHLYATIDLSALGDVPWQCIVTQVPKDVDECTPS